jgi:hypothetical protein
MNLEEIQHERSKIKIVIVSHIKYTVPLTTLFESMNKHCPELYRQIILVINGNKYESITKQQHLNSKDELIVIRTCLNIWEYTAFPMIKKYYDYDDVRSEYYMLIHDTCVVGPNFASNLQEHAKELSASSLSENPFTDKNKIGILRPKETCSNIIIIHKELIFKYENEVYAIKKKVDAIRRECDPNGAFYGYNVRICYKDKRLFMGCIDIYKTKHPRHCEYYKCFDLYKFVFFQYEGDFLGNVKKIEYDD